MRRRSNLKTDRKFQKIRGQLSTFLCLLIISKSNKPLGKQGRGIGARSRREFLNASRVHFREVEIFILIDAQPVYAPEVAREGRRAVRSKIKSAKGA